MGQLAHQLQTHGEEVRFIVNGSCECGYLHESTETMTAPLGAVSLVSLSEHAMRSFMPLTCTSCGRTIATGEASACYRVPGGPFLAASLALSGSDETPQLSIRSRFPTVLDNGLIGYLSASELDLASRLGQPLSVRAAWQEALFYLQLGGFLEKRFPAGAGVRCVATRDGNRRHDINIADLGGYGLWLSPEQVADLESRQLFLYLQVDLDMVRDEIAREVELHGFETTGNDPLTLQVSRQGGGFYCPLRVDELLNDAAGLALSLRVATTCYLDEIELRLTSCEKARSDIEKRLATRAEIKNGQLLFQRNGKRLPFDLERYLDANNAEKRALVNELDRQLSR